MEEVGASVDGTAGLRRGRAAAGMAAPAESLRLTTGLRSQDKTGEGSAGATMVAANSIKAEQCRPARRRKGWAGWHSRLFLRNAHITFSPTVVETT